MKRSIQWSKPSLHRLPPLVQAGFSLVELAMVLFVVTLLLGSILVPLGAQVEKRQYAETEKQLEQIKEALLGFALSKGHLPCPAKSATVGEEDRTGTTCTGAKRVGFLPWVTLGVRSSDAWGNLFLYSVTPAFADSGAGTGFTLDEPIPSLKLDWITMKTRNNTAAVNLSVDNSIPAAVLSHGKNGYGATSNTGSARALPGTWNNKLDEFLNANNSDVFWSRTRTANTSAAGGQFDDVVIWISPSILYSRMVAAGRLP